MPIAGTKQPGYRNLPSWLCFSGKVVVCRSVGSCRRSSFHQIQWVTWLSSIWAPPGLSYCCYSLGHQNACNSTASRSPYGFHQGNKMPLRIPHTLRERMLTSENSSYSYQGMKDASLAGTHRAVAICLWSKGWLRGFWISHFLLCKVSGDLNTIFKKHVSNAASDLLLQWHLGMLSLTKTKNQMKKNVYTYNNKLKSITKLEMLPK